MNAIGKVFFGAVVLAMTAGTASAEVVCNHEGDCWRVRGSARYEPGLNLRIHPDNWRWRSNEHYRWREHGGNHGYYRNGAWVEIR
jgi:hypothetical protein